MSIPNIQQLRKEASRNQSKWPWWLWTGVISVSLFVLVVIALFLAAPPFARKKLEQELSAKLHRPVKVAKVRINPLALSVAIEGLQVNTKTGAEFLEWKRFYINFEAASLFSHELHFSDVSLEGFVFHAYLGADGKLNFDDLIQEYAGKGTAAPEPAKAEPSKPWPVTVDNLHFDCRSIAFTDTSRGTTFASEFVPISFTMQGFHTNSASLSTGEFSAQTESGETFAWKGGVSLRDLVSDGTLEINGVRLPKYTPYYSSVVRFDILDGKVDFKTHYHFALEKGQPVVKLDEGAFLLSNLKVAPRGSSAPLLSLASLAVTGIEASTADRTAGVKAVTLSGGDVRVHRDGAVIDVLEMVTPPKGPAAPAAPSATAGGSNQAPWVATLGSLALDNFSIDFTDTTPSGPAHFLASKLAFRLGQVSTASLDKPSTVEFSTDLSAGGHILVSGDVTPAPLAFNVKAKLDTVSFAGVSPYIESVAPLKVLGGNLSLEAQASGSLPDGAAPVLNAKADLNISDFATADSSHGDPLAGWKKLALHGIEFSTSPAQKLVVAEVVLSEPRARVAVLADKSLNVSGPSRPGPKPEAAKPAASAQPLPVSVAIDKVTIENGEVAFEDQSLQPNVRTGLEHFGGTITGLSSANIARADVALEGRVDGSAPFQINGQINPLSDNAFTDLKVAFRGIDLLPVGPYVGKYAGRELTKGSLSLDVKVKFSKRQLDAATLLTLDQFTLGGSVESKDATSLPVGLALALLRDTQGKIVIDLPVKGSLDDPSFKIWGVVGHILGNILTKAAVSPFSLIGSMFGGGGDELGIEEFAPGSPGLAPSEIKKLDTVAKALVQRPGLSVDVGGVYDTASDVFALREDALTKRLQRSIWEEMRLAGPGMEIPAPESIKVTPEAEARLVSKYYQGLVAVNPAAATAELPKAPAPAPKPAPKPSLLRRIVNFFAPSSSDAVEKPSAPAPSAVKAPTKGSENAATVPVPGLPPLAEMRQRVLASVTVDDNALPALASDRAEAIRKYLVEHGAPSERVFLVPVSNSGLRVKLVLK